MCIVCSSTNSYGESGELENQFQYYNKNNKYIFKNNQKVYYCNLYLINDIIQVLIIISILLEDNLYIS